MVKLIAVTDIRTYDDNGEPEPMERSEMATCEHCGKALFVTYEVSIDGKTSIIGSECYRKLTGSAATKAQISNAIRYAEARKLSDVMKQDNLKEIWTTLTYQQRQDYYTKFTADVWTIDLASKIYNGVL